MTEKTLQTRIQNKHATESSWNSASDFIPKAGELIVYDTDTSHNKPRLKVGNGATAIGSLPFADEDPNAVHFNEAQSLTTTQEAQARTNIGAAPLASPTFTGTPKAPSPATSDDSTRIATTAYVRDVIPTIKVNNATQADKIGSVDVGTSVLPVWIDNGTPKAISIKNLTAVDDAGYDVSGDRSKLITLSTLAFWNGASQGTTSNLSRAKTPATNSDTNEIATTAWVRDVVPTIASNWSFNTNSFSTSGNTVSLKMASETELGGVKAWVETENSTTYFCVEIAD